MTAASWILPTYQSLPGLTTQMLNSPLATAWLVVQVTGRASPWFWLVVPVGAVTVMNRGLIGTAAMASQPVAPAVQLMVTELPEACLVLAAAMMLVAGLDA